MKTLSVVVPSYNCEAYLSRCLDSMLPATDDIEILVVNDGSTDGTADLARHYAERNPGIVRVLTKPNGGHGSAINTGIAEARGRYLKVMDSDDWVNPPAMTAVMEVLREQLDQPQPLDALVTNFVYEKQGKRHKHVMRYESELPTGRVFGWDEVGKFAANRALLMHSLLYRTEVLRESGLRLPEHTFYVDNLFAFVPLTCVRRLRYLDVNLYRYYIGRGDQSVNEQVMLGRIDQQLRVNRAMIDALPAEGSVPDELYRYLVHYLGLVCAISSILLLRLGTDDGLRRKRDLWQELRSSDATCHRLLRRSSLGQVLHLPGRGGRWVCLQGYRLARGVIGFN